MRSRGAGAHQYSFRGPRIPSNSSGCSIQWALPISTHVIVYVIICQYNDDRLVRDLSCQALNIDESMPKLLGKEKKKSWENKLSASHFPSCSWRGEATELCSCGIIIDVTVTICDNSMHQTTFLTATHFIEPGSDWCCVRLSDIKRA